MCPATDYAGDIPTCFICGKLPSSFYIQIDSCKNRKCVICSLLDVELDRLFLDYPGVVGTVCLSYLSAYKKETADLTGR